MSPQRVIADRSYNSDVFLQVIAEEEASQIAREIVPMGE